MGSNHGHDKYILYYFHKSVTFMWGKNSKCTSLIMNGFYLSNEKGFPSPPPTATKSFILIRLRKNFGAILHPRVRNILSHELATNTIWHFRHLIFHIWKENGGIYQKKRNVLFTGLEKCLIFTFCRIKRKGRRKNNKSRLGFLGFRLEKLK